jgi:indole-3-glycerol phosphate synthase
VGSGFLEEMAASSAERAAALGPLATWLDRARDTPPAPAIELDGFGIIAEVKRRAPSVGQLVSLEDDGIAGAVTRATTYAQAGAVAVSVLTEPSRFAGDMRHLEAVAAALQPVGVPAMRKDFLVSLTQVAEARVAGAGGVLLIARMLPGNQLGELVHLALDLGMFVLVEAFDESDLRAAAGVTSAGVLVGVNTRDLSTLEVDPNRLARLAPLLPKGVPAVAESGLRVAADVKAVADMGYRLALVGSALMQAPDPGALLAGMRAAPCG